MNGWSQFHLLLRACCIFGVAVMGLASCSSFTKEKSGAEVRKEGYAALLKTVKPGMYRRQLYAVLPPQETPLSVPPLLMAVAYTGSTASPLFRPHMECHHLDEECYLIVFYQLKKGAEYGLRDITSRKALSSALDSTDTTPDSSSEWIPFRKGQPPSKENPDDIILSVSGIHFTNGAPGKLLIPATGSPIQEEGELFGRGMVGEPRADFPLPMTSSP
jgi:hypothetical protein